MSPIEISRSIPMASDAYFDGWLNAHGGSEREIVVAIKPADCPFEDLRF